MSEEAPDPTVTLSHFLSTFDLLQRQVATPSDLEALSTDSFPARLASMTKEFVSRLRSIETLQLSGEEERAIEDFENRWWPAMDSREQAAVFADKHVQGQAKLDEDSFGSRGKLIP